MSTQKEKILVVDDDLDVLDLVAKQALAPMGYLVATATDGAAGLQRVLQLQPDVVIASLQLPGLSGKDLMFALRSQGVESPVIVTAPHGLEAQVIAAFRLGATDYLTKPLRETEVIAAVDRALRDTRLRRERAQLAESLAQANRQLERRVKELTTLYGIGKAVTSITDLQQLFGRVVEGALFVTEAELGYVLLAAEDETNKLILRAQKNMPAATARFVGAPFDDGLSSLVIRSGEPLHLAGESLGRFKIAHLMKAALVVPMKVKERAVGAIVVGNRVARAFGDRDAAMLSAVADYASIALVNTRLFQEIELRAHALQHAYDDLAQGVKRKLRVPLAQAETHVDFLARGDHGPLTPQQAEAVKAIAADLAAAVRLVENLGGAAGDRETGRQGNR